MRCWKYSFLNFLISMGLSPLLWDSNIGRNSPLKLPTRLTWTMRALSNHLFTCARTPRVVTPPGEVTSITRDWPAFVISTSTLFDVFSLVGETRRLHNTCRCQRGGNRQVCRCNLLYAQGKYNKLLKHKVLLPSYCELRYHQMDRAKQS